MSSPWGNHTLLLNEFYARLKGMTPDAIPEVEAAFEEVECHMVHYLPTADGCEGTKEIDSIRVRH